MADRQSKGAPKYVDDLEPKEDPDVESGADTKQLQKS